jgi:predicted transglutaminase-like cysteine proteinase
MKSYGTSGKGDCEDYVLEKKRKLLQLGWAPASLLITVVIDKQGGGHAVLTAVTDKGDYVLDNVTDEILLWSDSGLTFVKRQFGSNPNAWVDLGRRIGSPAFVATAKGQ